MIAPHNKDQFEQLVKDYIHVRVMRDIEEQRIFEQMTRIATKMEIAQALDVDRKTLYIRHKWKKVNENQQEM